MGFFNPFSYWTSTTNDDDSTNAHSPDKDEVDRTSWTFLQDNGIEIVAQKTTPATTTEAAFKDLIYADKPDPPEANLSLDRQVGQSGYIEQDPRRNSKLLWRGSVRLSGIKTLLRPRRHRHSDLSESDKFDSTIEHPVQRHSHPGVFTHFPDTTENQHVDTEESPTPTQEVNSQLAIPEQRKVSDKTVGTMESFESEGTTSTVCRHPSKCPAVQAILENRGYVYEEPFGDFQQSFGSSNLSTDVARDVNTDSRRPSISEYGDDNHWADHGLRCSKRRAGNLPRRSSIFRDISNISNESTWSAHIDQQKTVKAFNDMAGQLCLRPVAFGEEANAGKDRKPDGSGADKLHKRDKILGRIRSMRSNIQMRSQSVPPETEQRRVRRMKTFANLSSRPDPFSVLKGKSLETLARLGGYSYLKPQADFAPAVLKLPVCFAATATYLQIYGRRFFPPFAEPVPLTKRHPAKGHRVENLFFDPGDMKTASRIYEHFAHQVLSAEREEDKIQMTMRSNQMPVDIIEPLQRDTTPEQSPSYILSVAWVFKALLAGIPDGILGSKELYQVLVDISYGRQPYIFSKRRSKNQSKAQAEPEVDRQSKSETESQSKQQPVSRSEQVKPQKRPDDCLEGLTPWEHTQTKAIALAILSLTSKMHLELICAVFGLCEVLLHEVQRHIEDQWVRNIPRKQQLRPSWAAGLLDVDRLSRTLGPLLTNRTSEGEEGLCCEYRVVPSALQAERVVRMLLEHWRGVSRQLRWWEHCGCPPERVILPPEEEEQDEPEIEIEAEGANPRCPEKGFPGL